MRVSELGTAPAVETVAPRAEGDGKKRLAVAASATNENFVAVVMALLS
jgi:hypothetical protein